MNNNKEIRLTVKTRVMGKPRFLPGVWLIKLGAHLARVHVRVWVEEERVTPKESSWRDTLTVIGILIAAAIFFWIGWGILNYFGWGAPNS